MKEDSSIEPSNEEDTDVVVVQDVKSDTTKRSNKNTMKKSSVWKWLLFVILIIGLGVFITMNPELGRYLPDMNTPPSNGISDNRSSSSSNVGYRQNGDSTGAVSAASAYLGLTASIPILIAVIAAVTIINTIIFISISLGIGRLRTTIEDLSDDLRRRDIRR